MKNDNDPLLERFKNLHEQETMIEKRNNLINSDYPSFFFKDLILQFKEKGDKIKDIGINFKFDYFDDSNNSYSHQNLELKKEYLESDESNYDISFEQYILNKEKESRLSYYREEYENYNFMFESFKEFVRRQEEELINEIENENYNQNIDDEGYSESEGVYIEKKGHIDIRCSKDIFRISFENFDAIMDISLHSEITYRYHKLDEYNHRISDNYIDVDESDYGRFDDMDYVLHKKIIKYNPKLCIRFYRNYLYDLIKNEYYSITIGNKLEASWNNETNHSLINTVFSWFLEELEKED
jgi:hypothetical protein